MPILTVPTLAEVADLIRAKDYELGKLDAAQAAFLPTWTARDGAAAAAWTKDYQALVARYQTARAHAEGVLTNATPGNVVPLSVLPDVTGELGKVVATLQKAPGVVSPGDFEDVWQRLTTAQNAPITEDARVIQPTATDWDLQVYQGADATLKTLGSVGRKTGSGLLVAGAIALGVFLALRGRR